MKELNEVGFANIERLVAEYQAFVHTFRHMSDDEELLEQSLDSVLQTEDAILETGWIVKEIEEHFNEA